MTAVQRLSTADLEAEADVLDGHACDDFDDCEKCARSLAVERELDARELWDNDDDRVRESVGHYAEDAR